MNWAIAGWVVAGIFAVILVAALIGLFDLASAWKGFLHK